LQRSWWYPTAHHGALQTQHRHLMQPVMDSHRGARLQPRLSAQVKQECNPGRVSIFSAAKKEVFVLSPIEEGARRPPVEVYAARSMGGILLASIIRHIVSVAR
jgi:hypothetical protein